MNFICTLSDLNVHREMYLENSFDAHVSLHIHFTSMYIYQHQSYTENSNQKTTNFSLSKKFLVISRVDFRERERENCDTHSTYRVFWWKHVRTQL